jgi:hypothetical protein
MATSTRRQRTKTKKTVSRTSRKAPRVMRTVRKIAKTWPNMVQDNVDSLGHIALDGLKQGWREVDVIGHAMTTQVRKRPRLGLFLASMGGFMLGWAIRRRI